jgi:hypothetical protein
MKCLKNQKTGNIIRVNDVQANQMSGNTWQYVPKSEWKSAIRIVSEKQEIESEKKAETVSEKALKRSKIKSKQRPAEALDKI